LPDYDPCLTTVAIGWSPTTEPGDTGHPAGAPARPQRVTVRAPATIANLGAGFDCLGLAVDLWNEVTLVAGAEQEESPPVKIYCHGAGSDILVNEEVNRTIAAIRLFYQELGRSVPPLTLYQRNLIPLARGLGSSAAATISGLVAVNDLAGRPLDNSDLLQLAIRLEGHPDNAAPAFLGGLVLSVSDRSGLVTLSLPLPDGLQIVLFVPDFPLPTAQARAVLPTTVPRSDAVFNVGRAALLVSALSQGRFDLLDVATQDRLHQPYRETLFPAMPELLAAARQAGASATFLSGAGSSLAAFCHSRKTAERVAAAFTAAATAAGITGQVTRTRPNRRGAHVVVNPAPE